MTVSLSLSAWPDLSLVTVCLCSSVSVPALHILYYTTLPFLMSSSLKKLKCLCLCSKAVSSESETLVIWSNSLGHFWTLRHCWALTMKGHSAWPTHTCAHTHNLNRWPQTKEWILVDNPIPIVSAQFFKSAHTFTHKGVDSSAAPAIGGPNRAICCMCTATVAGGRSPPVPGVCPLWPCQPQVGALLPNAHSSDRRINEADLLTTKRTDCHTTRLVLMASVPKTEHSGKVRPLF